MTDNPPTPEAAAAFVEALTVSGMIVCYSQCWGCMFGQCYDPAQPHPWWDGEDVEAAEAAGQQPPAGNCACPCAKTAEEPTL